MKHVKRIVITLFSIIFILITTLSEASAISSEQLVKVTFTDLPESETGYTEVTELYNRRIITGFSDGTFKPFDNISRQHVAVFLYRALELDSPKNIKQTLSTVSDISEKHPYAKEIASVIEAGVFTGSNGKFNPNANMTRGQMASVLVRAFHLKETSKTRQFIDLPNTDPSHRENIIVLAQNNITLGKQNSKGQLYFDAEGLLNRIQFSIFLYRALQINHEHNLKQFETEVVTLTNNEREKYRLSPLQTDLLLSKVAREKSYDMLIKDYFDHYSPTYGSPFEMMKQFGVTYRSAGENIAIGYQTPEQVVQAWMNSPDHRKNILNESFTHIGIGYIETGNIWTQQFIGK